MVEDQFLEKSAFLTFDDGPHEPYTSQILDILKKFGARASFFVCGKNVERYPKVAKRIVKEGHLIGNHTYSHSKTRAVIGLLAGEIEKTNKVIKETTGKETRFFRPPWGILTPPLKVYLKKHDFKVFLWNVDARDWIRPPAEVIAKRIIKKTKPNNIILLHDGEKVKKKTDRSQTVLALPKIIEGLQKRKFIFKRPDERN